MGRRNSGQGMSRAEVFIEDDPETGGTVVKFKFMGEAFNPRSKAHQLCNIVRKYLDAEMISMPDKPNDDPERVVVTQ